MPKYMYMSHFLYSDLGFTLGLRLEGLRQCSDTTVASLCCSVLKTAEQSLVREVFQVQYEEALSHCLSWLGGITQVKQSVELTSRHQARSIIKNTR